jgi:hypothetical protein
MKSFLNKRIVIAATALVLLGGAAAAVAATGSSSGAGEQAYINDLASRLKVTPSALGAAIKAADSDQINSAMRVGRLTAAQAKSLEQRIAESTTAPMLGGGGFGARRLGARLGFRGGRFGGGRRGSDAIVTQYLGISDATLRTDLAAGESLATIANDTPNHSASGLAGAIISAETTRLNNAVTAKTITPAQETTRLANLSRRVNALLQRTWTGGWIGGHGRWRGRGGPSVGTTGPTGLFGYQPAA